MAFAVSGCNAGAEGSAVPRTTPPSKPIGLALSGYNYTNRYIDQFYVNGRGGQCVCE